MFKLSNLRFDETSKLLPLVERKTLCVLAVVGSDNDLKRERIVGYVIVFIGSPIVHYYTFFAALCYSGADNIGVKVPKLLYQDRSILVFKVGMGAIDYYIGYRNKLKEHIVPKTSTGSMHLDTAEAWRDGM